MDLRPSERLRLRIEQGKYRKDRFAMLPQNSWNCRATGVASPNLGFGWTKYGNPSATRVIDTRKRTLGAHLNIRVKAPMLRRGLRIRAQHLQIRP